MKIVVIGSRGWVARSTLASLEKLDTRTQRSIYIFGSERNKRTTVRSNVYSVHSWVPGITMDCDLFVPTAFLRAEKIDSLGERVYRETCTHLIRLASEFVRRNRPKWCLLTSSGIVSTDVNFGARGPGYLVYRELKQAEEYALATACEESGTKLLICRLFSASGEFLTGAPKFAISQMILQALEKRAITIQASNLVYRRYIDMEQLIYLCISSLLSGKIGIVESGGTLVEMGELANLIGRKWDASVIGREFFNGEADHYHSNLFDCESMALDLSENLSGLEEQLSLTYLAVKSWMANAK